MKMYLLTIVLVFLFPVAVFSQTDNDDTQLWNETTVEFSIRKDGKGKDNLNGVIIGNLRVTDNITDFSDKRIGFGLKIRATKNISITPSYIFRADTASSRIRYEHRLRLDIVPKLSREKFSVENRSRFEHRFKTNGRDDDTFYRNRTKLKVPVKRREKEVFTPFVSNDTYFDLQNPRVHRNDTVGGISKKFNNNLTTEFFYQFRQNFQSSTKYIHIVGVNLKFDFTN